MENFEFILKILGLIVSICAIAYSFYKFKVERKDKIPIQDFEQFNKYFSRESLPKLKKESILMQDMACQAISHFRGFRFSELEVFFDSKINLDDLLKVLKLKTQHLIGVDESGNLSVIKSYYTGLVKLSETRKRYERIIWIIFVVWVTFWVLFSIFVIGRYVPQPKWNYIFILDIVFTVLPEFFVMYKIHIRYQVEWFETEWEKISYKKIKDLKNLLENKTI